MNTIFIDGHASITTNNENQMTLFQFLPDDQDKQVVIGCQGTGTAQLMRNGALDFVKSPKRQRANSTLIRKAAHGRLSATRDQAIQLTLKIFKAEGLDVKETLRREALELIENTKL